MKAEEWHELSEIAGVMVRKLREAGGLADTVQRAENIRQELERQGRAALWEEFKRDKERPGEATPRVQPDGTIPKNKKKVTKEDAQSAILEAERLVALYQYDNVLTPKRDQDASTALNILTDARITLREGRGRRGEE